MNDMTSVIVAKSDQINADDLVAGPRTIRITGVSINTSQEQPVSISIEGDKKYWRPCKTMSRVLVAAWGPDANKYVGKSATLYRDPNVTWAGLAVGGIRISHMSDIDPKKVSNGQMVITLKESRKNSKPTIIKLLQPEQPAAQPPTDDPARKFTFAFLAKVAKLTDPAAVQAYADEKAEQLAKLREKRPELAAEIDLALSNKLGSADDFDDPDPPATVADSTPPAVEGDTPASDTAPLADFAEGPDDSQRGEQLFADDDVRDAVAKSLIASVKVARDPAGIDNVLAKHGADYDALPDDLRAEVDAAVAARRATFEGGK